MFRISMYLCAVVLLVGCALPVSAQDADGNRPPGTITGSGTADFVPVFTGKTTIANSKIFQTVGGNIGIATTTPAAKLDVDGTVDARNTLTLFHNGTHPTLSVHGTAFEVSSTGLVTFVSGQSFPGAGTVTSVGSGAGLTGGPITKSGTLSIATAGVTNAMLQNSSVTVNAGTDLTGGGTVALGGNITLGLDTTRISVGYSAIVPRAADIGLTTFPGTLVAQTNTIAASGLYYISAAALLNINPNDSLGAFCYDVLANTGAISQIGGSSSAGASQGYQQASIADALDVEAGDRVQLVCYSSDGAGSYAYDAAITATLINGGDDAKRRSPRSHGGLPPGVRTTK